MTQAPEEKIDILNKLDRLLERKFNGEYEEDDAASIRKKINEIFPIARKIVIDTNCFKLLNITPPPAIGGAVIQNMDPFDTIFESFYGMSFIPNIRDTIETHGKDTLQSRRAENTSVYARQQHPCC